MDHQDLLDHEEIVVNLDLLDQRDLQDRLVKGEKQDHQVHQDLLDPVDPQAPLDQQVSQVLEENVEIVAK